MSSGDNFDQADQIAVIGLGCRLPGARNAEEFWQNLRDGIESIRFFSDDELRSAGILPAVFNNPLYVRARAVLDDVESFDAPFFGYSPREAEILDPQQRLFLECASEALEDAGYDPDFYKGRIGVYGGANMNTYLLFNLLSNQGLIDSFGSYQTMLGSDKDFLATRVSYKLNLRGPSVTVQTACSTSLVATHLACQSLLSGECDIALAGGVSIVVPQKAGYLYQEGGIFSHDGHCRAFDAKSNGCVEGNGAGIVVLKRLDDALADGDNIRAVIRGSAVNNDGSLKVGYTAPGIKGQMTVIAEAMNMAGVEPESISYIEAHGTGTMLGDPIEISALTQAFRQSTRKTGYCAIGSVKTNIGHLDAAAGIAGLIKTVLALEHHLLPPSLGYEQPNPKIDFDSSPFYVNASLTEWKSDGSPLRAGVSSFGIGGTNAHVIVEQAPRIDSSSDASPYSLLSLSAKTSAALDVYTSNLATHLKQHPELSLPEVAYTLQVGRKAHAYRRIVVCRNSIEAVEKLETRDAGKVFTSVSNTATNKVSFLFSGQGSQYVGMGFGLYESEPTFRHELDRCSEILKDNPGLDLLKVLYPDEGRAGDASLQLMQTQLAQPALFAIEYALARMWMAWGIEPHAMAGHSIGEYVAACLAGVFSLKDALVLVSARGQLMQSMPPGAMLAMPLSELEARPLLGQGVSLAAINGPASCVASGPIEAVEALEAQLSRMGKTGRRLMTSHAFHSEMMSPVVGQFTQKVRQVQLNAPNLPYISNVTGDWITAEQATDPVYWGRHLREPVSFEEGLRHLLKSSDAALLEVGPGQALASLARKHPQRTGQQVFSSLRQQSELDSDLAFVLTTAGRLWIAGAELDWTSLNAGQRRRRVSLPTYPFERQRYWVEPQMRQPEFETQSLSLGKEPDLADWFYTPIWKQSPLPTELDLETELLKKRRWMIFLDEAGLGSAILDRLRRAGLDAVGVKPADGFEDLGNGLFEINPRRPEDYSALLEAVKIYMGVPQVIAHLWSVTQADSDLERAQAEDFGFYSLLSLAQALGKLGAGDPITLGVVANLVERIAGEEIIFPEKAALLGPCKVIPQEYSGISCRLIDTDITKNYGEANLIEQLLLELALDTPETSVAYRGNNRWKKTFEKVRIRENDTSTRLRERGVYLITGGHGGVGFHLAQYLARTVGARLVLTGRNAVVDEEQVRQLEEAGADVLTLTADVSDREQMSEVIRKTKERFGELHGVIHAAGIAGQGTIQLKARADAEAVLASKVAGAQVLYDLLKDDELDFILLCSSLNSIIGGFGQVDYCAANAFLDAFAQDAGVRRGPQVISINWDTWEGVGMARLDARSNGSAASASQQAVDHPLFDAKFEEAPNRKVYITKFSPQTHWILDEHRIVGNPVIPGTAYLQMILAAFEDFAEVGPTEISDLYFITPLNVADGEQAEVQTIIEEVQDGYKFAIRSNQSAGSATAKWQDHAIGRIKSADLGQPKKLDLETLIARCRVKEIDGEQEDQKEADIGPRWDTFKRAYIGKDELVAAFELSSEFSADLVNYDLHPALLDASTGVAKKHLADEGIYLPLSYKRLKIHGPLPRKIYSYARYNDDGFSRKETMSYNITITDEHGVEVIEIEEYTAKRVNDVDLQLKALAEMQKHEGQEDAREKPASNGNLNRPAVANGMTAQEGVEVFKRILSGRAQRQIAISTVDLNRLIEQTRSLSQLLRSANKGEGNVAAHARPEMQTPYEAPQTELEVRVAQMWQDMLGIAQIGLNDNFFELGGDSVLAIQIVARANQAGLQMTPQQLFQHQTVRELAAVVGGNDTARADEAPAVGPVPLSPIQLRFFELSTDAPNPSARVMLFEVTEPLKAPILEKAFTHLLKQHDALRLQFERRESVWGQTIREPELSAPFSSTDLSGLDDKQRQKAIEEIAFRLEASLDISEAPLMRVEHLNCGAQRPDCLLIAIHELVIDTPSWSILLDDLQLSYRQLERGESVQLPPGTDSFKKWSEHLTSRAAAWDDEDFWNADKWKQDYKLPGDMPESEDAEPINEKVSINLSLDETTRLFEEALASYRADIEEVLLSSLAQALSLEGAPQPIVIDLETDWRKHAGAGLNLSRTIGCLKGVFPARLNPGAATDATGALKLIKEQLRRVPDHGLSYGVLRYLKEDQERLASQKSGLCFRYTGSAESILPKGTLLARAVELSRQSQADRCYSMIITATIENRCLKVEWAYRKGDYLRSTVNALASRFCESLRSLIAEGQSEDVGSLIPSDFPLAKLNEQKLSKLSLLLEMADEPELEVSEQ
ncbi:MAG: SDR family NAD(P)-dependent oxidoreductase [Blastocatellia bacterium]